MLRVVFIVGFILYSVFLIVATHLPRIPTIARWPGVDKWLHFFAYGCQTVLAMGVLYFTKGLKLKNVALLIVVLKLAQTCHLNRQAITRALAIHTP